jgi:hypothetical protein
MWTLGTRAMTPPPRQTSPSYSTADWPGVTAHCGSVEVQPKRSPAGPADSRQAASAWR